MYKFNELAILAYRRIIFNYWNFVHILPALIISISIALLILYLIMRKYPQEKLFFSLGLLSAIDYSGFVCPVNYSLKDNLFLMCIVQNPSIDNFSWFDKDESERILHEYEKTRRTIFLLNCGTRQMIGKSRFFKKEYRTFFHIFYGLITAISTAVIILILLSAPIYIYFLIPHFGYQINYLIGYALTILFPLEILSLIYLLQKDIVIFIFSTSMIFLLTPYIFKLRSAPPLYPGIIFIYTYIAIIILTNIIVYKFFNRQKLIKISYISSFITYMVLFFITFFNIIIFFYG